MRRIVRHRKYQAQLKVLESKHPGSLDAVNRLEQLIAASPGRPISIFVPKYDCWWSHLLDDDDSIPHMRVFHTFDDDEVRFLTIVPAEIA